MRPSEPRYNQLINFAALKPRSGVLGFHLESTTWRRIMYWSQSRLDARRMMNCAWCSRAIIKEEVYAISITKFLLDWAWMLKIAIPAAYDLMCVQAWSFKWTETSEILCPDTWAPKGRSTKYEVLSTNPWFPSNIIDSLWMSSAHDKYKCDPRRSVRLNVTAHIPVRGSAQTSSLWCRSGTAMCDCHRAIMLEFK